MKFIDKEMSDWKICSIIDMIFLYRYNLCLRQLFESPDPLQSESLFN